MVYMSVCLVSGMEVSYSVCQLQLLISPLGRSEDSQPAVIRAVKGAWSGLSHTFCRVYWSFGGNSCG